MLAAVTAGDSVGVTENYLDRKTICWLSKGCKSCGAGAWGGALQHVAGAGILSGSFPTKTSLLRALSLKVTISRPRLLKSVS